MECKVILREKSCGMAVFNKAKDNLYVLVVRHKKGHWGLPKGHVEEKETEVETAIRETFEETGIKAKVLGDFREVITYSPKENVIKDVVFFVGEPLNDELIPQLSEVESVHWIEVNDALNLEISNDLKNVLINAIDYYKEVGI